MYYLLIGFIAPAILFAILGLIACIRRGSMSYPEEDKEYQSVDSDDGNLSNLKSKHLPPNQPKLLRDRIILQKSSTQDY
uniref:Uncharacterized protein n=1 Tax=Heterorhabditis bacteriophora TaxID=37862 RepID=A0A1I7XR29_HETBA